MRRSCLRHPAAPALPSGRAAFPQHALCLSAAADRIPRREFGPQPRRESRALRAAFRRGTAAVFGADQLRSLRSIRSRRCDSLVGRVHDAAEHPALPVRQHDGTGFRDSPDFDGFLRALPAADRQQLLRAAGFPLRADGALPVDRAAGNLRVVRTGLRRVRLHDPLLLHPSALRDIHDRAVRLHLRNAVRGASLPWAADEETAADACRICHALHRGERPPCGDVPLPRARAVVFLRLRQRTQTPLPAFLCRAPLHAFRVRSERFHAELCVRGRQVHPEPPGRGDDLRTLPRRGILG